MMQRSLAEKLRVLRARRGLSLSAAAEQLGINRHTLRDLELGDRTARYPTLAKIAKGYQVPVEELMAAEEPVLAGKAEAPEEGRKQATRRADRLRLRRRLLEKLLKPMEKDRESGLWDGELDLNDPAIHEAWELSRRYALLEWMVVSEDLGILAQARSALSSTDEEEREAAQDFISAYEHAFASVYEDLPRVAREKRDTLEEQMREWKKSFVEAHNLEENEEYVRQEERARQERAFLLGKASEKMLEKVSRT